MHCHAARCRHGCGLGHGEGIANQITSTHGDSGENYIPSKPWQSTMLLLQACLQ